ncbi:WD repeat-containing protein 6 [Bienertia sinuspersici]
MDENKVWRVEGGQYLGEISALCFLQIPSSFSSLPFLLAGSGTQIILFDVNLGRQIKSYCVFEGVRVHGIASGFMNYEENPLTPSVTFKVVVSGERIVKLYSLRLQLRSECLDGQDILADLTLLQLLPRFTHWVLDFCFLENGLSSLEEGCCFLAVGCNDNSVHIWDVLTSRLMFKFWGNDFEALRIASGTIFNEIVVWKITRRHNTLTSAEQQPDIVRPLELLHPQDCLYFEAEIVSKLAGHQGSIFCLSWSNDGSKLVSVSDDRSARMWIANAEMIMTDDLTKLLGPYSAGPVLFGHGARVWDCCISDSFIVTAGEDCTCRVWGLDGKELTVIKEHIGRGIWRCLYDPNTSLLVTAGFDSAIKAHCLYSSPSAISSESVKLVEESKAELFRVCIPNSSGQSGLMDSKSEYVRCLKFARKDMIYVATNHGYVYHVKLLDSGSVECTELIRITEEVPIICMDLLSRNPSELSLEVEDWVAIGDGRGTMKVIKVELSGGAARVAGNISWSAEKERQLLGAYWCKSIGCGFIFTSDPRGVVKLWRLPDTSSHGNVRSFDVYLVADFVSPFGARIMCLDASSEEEVLVCGDLRGNLVLFPLSKRVLFHGSVLFIEKTPSVTYFKGAHGISTVCSISLARINSRLIEICSTGGDGCICYLEYSKDHQTVEFVGMKHTKELSLVQTVSPYHCSLDDSANTSYAVGFSSTDFLIWNLLSEIKDEIIYVHRNWVPDGEKKIFFRHLHLQFHGREIHSLRFVPGDECAPNDLHPKSSWIATGCEDGTVRLTRYNHGIGKWAMSNLLGEHVGGSAVRSLCFASKVHSVDFKVVETANETCGTNNSLESTESPCLLISVGAKRVITSWLLRRRQNTVVDVSANVQSSTGPISSMSFKWLSTDMPVKCVRTKKKTQINRNAVRTLDKVPTSDDVSTSIEIGLEQHADSHDNDWRYLAVTAFLVNVAESRQVNLFTVCFVVVACSDATLMLRALVLPYRYWFDVASLVPLASPVLALQHAVTPVTQFYQGKMMTKNIFTVISGSTDGSIAFWDVTESIEAFVQRVPSFHIEKSIDFQKRPRTGRGSQGGRWWKSIDAVTAKEKSDAASLALNGKVVSSGNGVVDGSTATMILKDGNISSNNTEKASFRSGESFNDSSARFYGIKPLHVLQNVHQSGVNCLHISCQNIGSGLPHSIISGGDDQALAFLQFSVEPSLMKPNLDDIGKGDRVSELLSSNCTIQHDSEQSCSIKFSYQNKAIAAHSSAVKGVWTDGTWIFSTGLDQRVRCWKVQDHNNLIEHDHFITSVPEPEALDELLSGYARRSGEVHLEDSFQLHLLNQRSQAWKT